MLSLADSLVGQLTIWTSIFYLTKFN